jgi:hypothetical protein
MRIANGQSNGGGRDVRFSLPDNFDAEERRTFMSDPPAHESVPFRLTKRPRNLVLLSVEFLLRDHVSNSRISIIAMMHAT